MKKGGLKKIQNLIWDLVNEKKEKKKDIPGKYETHINRETKEN